MKAYLLVEELLAPVPLVAVPRATQLSALNQSVPDTVSAALKRYWAPIGS